MRPSFVTRPHLALDMQRGPPPRPPWRRGYGSYCLKATCEVLRNSDGSLVGRVVGYDRYVHIQDAVETACRITARDIPGTSCGTSRLTLLNDYRKECAGEVYFVFDGSSNRVF